MSADGHPPADDLRRAEPQTRPLVATRQADGARQEVGVAQPQRGLVAAAPLGGVDCELMRRREALLGGEHRHVQRPRARAASADALSRHRRRIAGPCSNQSSMRDRQRRRLAGIEVGGEPGIGDRVEPLGEVGAIGQQRARRQARRGSCRCSSSSGRHRDRAGSARRLPANMPHACAASNSTAAPTASAICADLLHGMRQQVEAGAHRDQLAAAPVRRARRDRRDRS